MSLVAAVAAFALGHAQIDPNVVIWRTYKSGNFSKASSQEIVEMNTIGDYQRYVSQYDPEGVGDARDVAWGKEELVAIHIGTRKSDGFSVAVDTIKRTKPTEACVFWSELTPVQGVSTSATSMSPWTIVRLNRPGAKLTYSGHKEEGRLPGGIKIIGFPGYEWGCDCCAACMRAQASRLPWRVYASGDDSPVTAYATNCMNSQIDFNNYVRNYRMGGLGDGSDIDWFHERLLAIHLGRKLTPGYQIVVDHVDVVDSTRVDVSFYQVDAVGRMVAANSATGPYLLVRIPRVGPLVTFTKKFAREGDRINLDSCSCGCAACRHCRR